MNTDIFSKRLKQQMDNNNMKQIELIKQASEYGIKLGKSQVSQYVSGKTFPRKNVLEVLAKVLNADVNWLAGEAESKRVEKERETMVREFTK